MTALEAGRRSPSPTNRLVPPLRVTPTKKSDDNSMRNTPTKNSHDPSIVSVLKSLSPKNVSALAEDGQKSFGEASLKKLTYLEQLRRASSPLPPTSAPPVYGGDASRPSTPASRPSTSRPVTPASSRKQQQIRPQSPCGRASADSGAYFESAPSGAEDEDQRETFGMKRLSEDVSLLQPRQGSISAANLWNLPLASMVEGRRGSTGVTMQGRISPALGRKWAVVIHAIKERRQKADQESSNKLAELDLLKLSLEQSQGKLRSLEVETDPLRVKLKRYEGIIEDLEEKLEISDNERVAKEQQRIQDLNIVESEKLALLEKLENSKFERDQNLKEETRHLKVEEIVLKKEIKDLIVAVEKAKSGSKFDEDNHPKLKQAASMRSELMTVRGLLESSERERVNERKEKLSAIQNMIKLTKQKADLEEELDDRRKSDHSDKSDKYVRLLAKFESKSQKLAAQEAERATEVAVLEKKYLSQVREAQAETEQLRSVNSGIMQLKSGRDKDSTDLNLVLAQLRSGLREQKPAKEILSALFGQYNLIHDRLHATESSSYHGDAVSMDTGVVEVEGMKEEKRQLKRKLSNAQSRLSTLDQDRKVAEMTYARQLEDVLAEKRGLALEMKRLQDCIDGHEDELTEANGRLLAATESLEKRNEELEMMREHLLSVTNEMNTVDADMGKVKRDVALKDAEIMRLSCDLTTAQEQFIEERHDKEKLAEELDSRKLAAKEFERAQARSHEQLSEASEALASSRLQAERLTSERDTALTEGNALQLETIEYRKKTRQFENVIDSLKTQNEYLEKTVNEKIELLSATSLEVDRKKTELLATQHILSEEETRSRSLDKELSSLLDEFHLRGKLLEKHESRCKQLEAELKSAKDQLDNMTANFQDTEFNLQNNTSTNEMLSRQTAALEEQCDSLSRELTLALEEKLESERKEEGTAEELRKMGEKVVGAKREIAEKMKSANENEREVARMRKEMQASAQEISDLHRQVKAAQQEMSTERRLHEDKMKSLKESGGEISDELERLRNNNSKELDELRNENETLRKDIQAAAIAMGELEDPIGEVIMCDVESSPDEMFARLDGFVPSDEKPATTTTKVHPLKLVNIAKRFRDNEARAQRSLVENQRLKDELEESHRLAIEAATLELIELEGLKGPTVIEEGDISAAEGDEVFAAGNDSDFFALEDAKNLEELNNMKNENMMKDDEIKKLMQQMSNEKSSMVRLQEEKEAADAVTRKLRLEIDELRQQLSDKDKELKRLLNQLSEKDSDMSIMLTKLKQQKLAAADAIEQMEKSLSEDIKNINRSHNSKTEEFNKQINELTEQKASSERRLREATSSLEQEKDVTFRDSMTKDGQIRTLRGGLETSDTEKRSLELRLIECETEMRVLKEQYKTPPPPSTPAPSPPDPRYMSPEIEEKLREDLNVQLRHAHEEKIEAIRLLKALVADNETLTQCIMGQQNVIEQQRNELSFTQQDLQASLEGFYEERSTLARTKDRLTNVMETTLTRESNIAIDQKRQISELQDALEGMRLDKRQLERSVTDSEETLQRKANEMEELKKSVEYKLGGFEATRSAKELIENQLLLAMRDRGTAFTKLASTELNNKQLQEKLLNMQKWHNGLELNLIGSFGRAGNPSTGERSNLAGQYSGLFDAHMNTLGQQFQTPSKNLLSSFNESKLGT